MSRPAPKVIRSKFIDKTEVEILESLGFWIVAYKGKPFGLRHYTPNPKTNGLKYPRLGFANLGHALRLAEKLNSDFNSNDFSVLKVA